MFKSAIVIIVAWGLALSAAQAHCHQDVTQTPAIRHAILGDKEPDKNIIVKVFKVCGDYAMATVSLANSIYGDGESDIAYLQRKDGVWELLDEGTGIDASELGIPKEVW